MAARIFASLAAIFLVLAVGIAGLTPTGSTLTAGLKLLDSGLVGWLQAACPGWLWGWVLNPVLMRPMWLGPASIGLVLAGLALTFNLGKPSPSRRRRS